MLLLGGILLVGLALRVSYLHAHVKSPGFDVPILDPGFNDYWARAMVTGDWTPPQQDPDPLIRFTPYLRPPGYAYFLASAYRIFGLSYLTPRLVQMAIGLENCLLAFVLARRWFGAGVGLVTAALMATYWILIYFEGRLEEPTLLIFILLAVIYVLSLWVDRRRVRYALAAGLLLGLAATVRPNPLLFLPIGAAWVCWVAYRRKERRRVYLQGVAGMAVGCAAVVAPTTIRNYRVASDFVLISANAGLNLYIGNNESANGMQSGRLPGSDLKTTCFWYPRIVMEVQREQGRTMKYSEVSAYFTAKALQFIREHPWKFLSLTLRRAAVFWGPQEIPLNEELDCERAFSGTLRSIPGNFAMILALSVLGAICLIRDLRNRKEMKAEEGREIGQRMEVSVLLAAFIATVFLSYVFFFNAASYRAPLLPLLMVFGAYGLREIATSARRGRMRRAAVWAAAGAALFLLARVPLIECPTPGWVAWHCQRASALARKGQLDLAIEEAEAGSRADPQSPRPHELLAMWLTEQGRFEAAGEHWKKAVELMGTLRAETTQPAPGL